MFIIICVFKPYLADAPSISDLRVFEKDKFFPILAELCYILLFFGGLLYPLLEQLEYRFDRLGGFLVSMADRGKERHLLSFVLKDTFENGSKGNIDFRRNLFFCKCGMAIVLLTPVVTFCSSAIILAVTVLPAAAGLAVFFVGLAFAVAMWMKHASTHAGYRMTAGYLRLIGCTFLSLYTFLLCSSLSFMWDVTIPFSLFSLTCIGFTANMVPMTFILVVGDTHLAFAYSRMHRIIQKNKKLSTVKGKFQALGTMGLKLAMLQASHQEQAIEEHGPSSLGSLLGKMYTIDTKIPAFQYTDLIQQAFTKTEAERNAYMRKWYFASLAVLIVYSVVCLITPEPTVQGLGLSIVILVLDLCVFLLRRGPTTFGTTRFVFLTFAGRACLCLFVGPNWVIGLSCAFFIYGVVLGEEIINQRMRTLSKEQAAAVAYFGRVEDPRNVDDVSASPEFVLGMLSGSFLLTLLSFYLGTTEMPTVYLGAREYGVWIFGVAAIVVVMIYVALGLARRAVMLSKKEILKTKRFLFVAWFDVPMMLVSLAELIVLMAGFALYVLTDGILIFVTALFVPPIFGIASKMYYQWKVNDFRFFQPAVMRKKEDERDDDEDAAKKKRIRRSSLRSLLKKPIFTDLSAMAKEKRLSVQLHPFGHQRIKKGQKATSKHWEDEVQREADKGEENEEVETIAEETKETSGMPDAESKGQDPSGKKMETSKSPAGTVDPIVKDEGPQEGQAGATNPEEEKGISMDNGLQETGESGESSTVVKRRKVINWLKKVLKISDETEAEKMTVVEALIQGKLTHADYGMLTSCSALVTLLVVYGLVLSFILNSFLYGNLVWILSLFLLSSLVPFRKYYGTMSITVDMKWSVKLAVIAECLAGLIVFVSVLGASFSDNYLALILVLMGSWPCVLLLFGLTLKWKEADWQSGSSALTSHFVRGFGFLLLNVVIITVWLGVPAGAVCFVVWGVAVSTWFLVLRWAQNQFNLPFALKRSVKLVLYSSGIGAFALSLLIATDGSSFLWISIGICAIELAHIVEICSLAGEIPDGMPVYFSTFVFPIYTLNPNTNDLEEHNALGVAVFRALFFLFLWGTCSIILVEPLDLGIALSCAAFLLLLGTTAYLVTRTPVWMGEAMLCLTEKEIKANAKQSRDSFNARWENLEISCDEYVLMDKQVQNRLTKFSRKAKAIQYDTRYTSVELANAIEAAESRLARTEFKIKDALLEGWRRGKGPLAPLTLGGYPWFLYKLVRSITNKKAKYIDFGDEDQDAASDQAEDLLDKLIEVFGVGGDLLTVEVLDHDLRSRNDSLGKVEIALDELRPDEVHQAWHKLQPSKASKETEESDLGEVEVSVAIRNIWGGLHMHVNVIQARGLQSKDSNGLSDAYCKISCGAYRFVSETLPRSLTPHWEGRANFRFPPVDDRVLLELKDQDLFGKGDALGNAMILLKDFVPEKEHVQWLKLHGGQGKQQATGEVQVAFRLSSKVSDQGLEGSGAALALTVIKARGLRAADRNGLSDPYCVCSCGQDAFRTSVIKRTLEPVWEEEYTFNASGLRPTETGEGGSEAQQEEKVSMENAWKIYLNQAALDRALSREFYEEMRASILFQLRLVVSSRGIISKEAISFQRFLREYRFKLLASGIEPPRQIFKSKSWATVDVHLVALWLLRLSPEQRQRFYQLKAKHSAELEQTEASQMQEDEQIKSHAARLKEWLAAQDAQRMQATADDLIVTDIARMQERLDEVAGGKSCDEDGLFVDADFAASKDSIAGIGNEKLVVGWKRAKEFNDRCELFKGGTDPDDIFQGILNNGWFLSAVSILAASGSVGDDQVRRCQCSCCRVIRVRVLVYSTIFRWTR